MIIKEKIDNCFYPKLILIIIYIMKNLRLINLLQVLNSYKLIYNKVLNLFYL